MKRIVFFTALMLIGFCAVCQSAYQKVDNKTFQQIKSQKNNDSTYHATGFFYEIKGVKYEIYTHVPSKGKSAGVKQCYIKRISAKTGKTYWQKIAVKPEELK